MKICSVSQSFYPYVGGVTRYLQALGKRLIERGDEMIVIHFKTPEMSDYEVVDNIRVYRMAESAGLKESMEGYLKFKELIIDTTHGSKAPVSVDDRFDHGYYDYLGFNLSMYEKVRQVYETEQFDLLHIHDFQVMPLAFLLKDEIDVPMVFTWHVPFTNAMPADWRDFMVRYLRYYDQVIFSTDEYVRTAVESGLSPDRVTKINPFIETSCYAFAGPNNFREKFGIPEKDHLLLCVSRMDPRKGQEYLIKALAEVVKKHPDTSCAFIGNGSLTKKLLGRNERVESLKALAAELGVADKVKFLGKVGQEDLLAGYDACDMVILPSINEGFGLVLSEAMCFGKPLIGSNIGGIPEQIVDGVNGYLFKPTDHEELAQYINSLIENPEVCKQMGAIGKELVHTRFCVERGYKDHCEIYDTIHLRKRMKDNSGTGESLLTG
ncbi:glycosyltransferase family 4 protein [Methanocella sp. MCL-LM]|uniref:glycosyltransferase family 4 protein n=1 Tax=Methanocella sp. MCL-LM TaxID=3412035 RepID=UPI003C763794